MVGMLLAEERRGDERARAWLDPLLPQDLPS